jgi:glycogen(starch) synthase
VNVFLSTDTIGGVWDYTLTLTRGLRGRGHAVLLAVLGEPSEERLRDLPAGVEVAARDFRLEWMPGGAGDIAPAGEWLGARAREWGADVAHLNQLAYSTHDFGAPTLVVLHSDVLSWFSETQGRDAPPEWDGYARRVRAGIAAADVLVAISAYASALTLRHFGRAADRVIHNGVVPPAEEPPPRTAPLLLSAGRAWDEAKGMAVLDRALARLAGDPAAHLFGEMVGPHGQRFEARRLICHGRAPRAVVDAWMRRASVYVAPSLYEPFGLAPLEAALHGCALVMSDLPVFRELWDGCAVFFPRGDDDALAAVLADLAPDLDRCAALAAAARERALERFTASRFVGEYEALYEEMSGRATSSPVHPFTPSPVHR